MFGGRLPIGEPKFNRVKKLQGVSDIPRFLGELLTGFFSRLTYIFKMVWRTGPWILVALIFVALLQGILPIVGSLISKEILNELQGVITAQSTAAALGEGYTAVFWGSAVMFLLVFYFIYRILNQIVVRLNAATVRIAGEKVTKYVRVQIMEKAKTVDIASFDLPEFYEKLENANREAGVRPVSVLSATFSAISTTISLVSYIVILATAPDMWWTALVMLAVSIPSAIITFYYRKKNFMYMRHRSKERRQMTYYSDIMVNKDMAKEIRIFDLSDHFIKRYDAVFGGYYRGLRSMIVRENVWHVIVSFLSSVINCVFFAMIAFGVFAGKIMIGDYSLYTGALTSIASNVSTLISVSSNVYEGTLFIDNLIAFLEEKETVVSASDKPATVAHGEPHTIEFEHVSFAYPGTDKKVIDDVSLTFAPGETVVLVGLNGAGKTTLIKLLTRLYDPTEGRILLDGRDLREYDVRDLHSMFGIIFQDFGKYAESVSDNIAFGDIRTEKDPSRIAEAARMANADGYISKLPRGYDTALMRYFEVDGTELSIGQWQKLSIARAFYSTSDIIILDEPTASLDAIAEQEIFNQFDMLRRDKTTIFVSHRLSSATVASKIVVLEGGRVVELGNHKELMAKGGKYYELFSTQARRYIESESEGE